ncbi:hypothetical protein GCM10022221_62840 [Actinocorallia aurea]
MARTNAARGRRAQRTSASESARLISEKKTVSMANPATGIGSPPTSRLIPANSPTAATVADAAAATAAATRPRTTNDLTETVRPTEIMHLP